MSLYRQEPSWQREQDTTNKVLGDPLADIYNESQWKVSKVSPLYNLQYNAVKLKQYASKIRQSIVSSVAANSSITYSVKLLRQSSWKYSEDDADGIEITVTSSQNSKTKVAYSAILMSWGEFSTLDDATHLPYLLERGEQRLSTAVKAAIRMIFDCNVRQFSFTQCQLLQFGFHFLENETSRGVEPFTLTFETPQAQQKDKVKVSFKLEDAKIIWNGVKEEAINSFDLINLAYQVLQSQIFYMVTMDITVFNLCEVTLPKAEVKSNGIVKMKTPEMVNCVFTVLNEISKVCTTKDISE